MSSGAGRRPHVLYVAWGFPPMAGGGTYRTLATANMLHDVGFDVTVLTAEREAFLGFTGVDDTLVERVNPAIEVVRIPFERPAQDFDIRHWPKERLADPNQWRLDHLAHEQDDFPEPSFGPWLKPMLAAAERIHERRALDLVIGSANPHVVLAAGDHLHTRHGVPYVIDHRDAWRLNCYTGAEAGTHDPRVAELETRYVENAHEIWFVNEPIRQWHRAMYPKAADRMRVVENGYDPAFAPAPQESAPDPDRPLSFMYLGTIGARVPIAETVEGWVKARRLSDEIARATATIHGPLPVEEPAKAQLLAGAAAYGLHYGGPVKKADVADVYAATDVLMLILSGGRYVTSGKVYEYLATGLPIVSVHEPGNGASDILRDYPLWFPARDLSVDSVAAALVAAAQGARQADADVRRQCVEFGQRYERSLQLREPIEELLRFVTSRERSAAR